MILGFVNNMVGQTTYYYKLTKKIQNGNEYTNTAGGQFITFAGNKCYDSDKYGISVGNGQLVYEDQYSSNSKTYIGQSYFGNVVYRFKVDLSVLNVIVNDNLIYVYKRQTAPSSATTCSLIRKRSGTSSGGGVYDQTIPNNGHGEVFMNGGSTYNTPTTSSSGNQPSKKVWHECSLCRGKRTIVRESYVATNGKDTQWYCSQCGRSVWQSSGHSHVTCTQCRGQGGYYTTQ